jgi:hypothetical protein
MTMNATRQSGGLEAMFGVVVTALGAAAIGCAGGGGVPYAAQAVVATYGGSLVQGTQGEWEGKETARAELALKGVRPGHVLLACAEGAAPGNAKLAVHDTGSHAWHELSGATSAQTGPTTKCWYATNLVEGTTTVSYTLPGATYVRGFVHDYAGAMAEEATANAPATTARSFNAVAIRTEPR